MAKPPIATVEQMYDDLAPRYDEEVGETAGAALVKARSSRVLRGLFAQGDHVIDIGCGTGVDACLLASLGVDVLAVDLSREMLEQTKARAASAGVSDRVRTIHIAASGVGDLRSEFGDGSFSGAYSLFGSLNLEPSLSGVRDGLRDLLRPEAPFLAGLVNPHVLWELTLYPLILRFDKPAKKSGRSLAMRVSNVREGRVEVQMLTPAEFGHRMEPDFMVEWVEGTNVFVPPPHLDSLARKFPGLWRYSSRLEQRLAARPPWNRLGYFSLILLRRRSA